MTGPRIAMLLWSGELGGVEMLTIDLAHALRERGVDARVVFVCARAPRGTRVDERDVPTVDVGFPGPPPSSPVRAPGG